MANRLEPINLEDFTGGLALRRNQFQLRHNESPEMNNMTVDPLGGIQTRRGWDRWNTDDIVDTSTATWDPRRALLQQLSDGTDIVYVANDNDLLYSDDAGATWTDAGIICEAVHHMADFGVYGDSLYVACGRTQPGARRVGTGAFTTLTEAGAGTWNDDYTTPVHGVMPSADLCEMHSGYLFVASVSEDANDFPNRIRWSHPTSPDDWAEGDYMDIGVGGSKITALLSFEDHLLIFKEDGIWALYGYDIDSWQLVQKSATSGTIGPQAVTRSEVTAFWYSASDRGAIYAYGGERPIEISEQLRTALEVLIAHELVWVGWIGRRLWVTLPWNYNGPSSDTGAVLVFDPSVGENGAWMYYQPANGSLGPIVGGSNVDSQIHPLALMRATETPCIVRLDAREDASDRVWDVAVLGTTGDTEIAILVDDADNEIIASGSEGIEPFETYYRTPWIDGGWPTRKKSFRRPDFIVRYTEFEHRLRIQSYRDYDESTIKRQSTMEIPSGSAAGAAIWGEFEWGDGTLWGDPVARKGAAIRRGSSYGLCKALQLRIIGLDPGRRWGIDAIILKHVMRRFR